MKRHHFISVSCVLTLPFAVATVGCGTSGSSDDSTRSDAGTDARGDENLPSRDGGDTRDGNVTDVIITTDSVDPNKCVDGQPCDDGGGVCAGGVCCEIAKACGASCCGQDAVCSFQKCVVPGKECIDSSDCDEQEYCELGLAEDKPDPGPDAGDGGVCVGGKKTVQGKCMPRPPKCDPDAPAEEQEGELTCLNSCQWEPTTHSFEAELKYTWQTTSPGRGLAVSPIVIQLDDDDCDGKITANDIPEIVFVWLSTDAYMGPQPVYAISVVNGKLETKWSAPGLIKGESQLAGGNIDGQPGNEVVGCGVNGPVALRGDGSVLWKNTNSLCTTPSLADIDGDGQPEVIVDTAVLDGATGTKKFALPSTTSPQWDSNGWFAADLDGDGKQELVGPSHVIDSQGKQLANTSWPAMFAAIADFDGDGTPEIVAVNNLKHELRIWRFAPSKPNGFEWVRQDSIALPYGQGANPWSGGPITIADFNGDGIPDIGLATAFAYTTYDGKKVTDPSVPAASTVLWSNPTQDKTSGATGSSLFDFNGDGRAEVIYSDEVYLRIYDGPTGKELLKTCNTTGTLMEYPLVADVDNDGQADIVVVSNSFMSCEGTSQTAVRVFGSKNNNWVRTRRIWNQHAYYVTNVEEDGTIPAKPLQNWKQKGLNNFRQNKQPGGEFSAPDAVVGVSVQCTSPNKLLATVRNVGEAVLPSGVQVSLMRGTVGSGSLLAELTTTVPLYPAQSQVVSWQIDDANQDIVNGSVTIHAKVHLADGINECRTDNNVSKEMTPYCSTIK